MDRSLSGPQQSEVLLRVMRLEVDGERLFDAVQATWNLLEPSAADALQAAHEAGLGVIIKEALANGRLTQRNQTAGFSRPNGALAALATRFDASMDAVALAAAPNQPWADVVLSGAATTPQLSSNLRALDIAWDEQANVETLGLAEQAEAYWRTRSQLAWN